MDQVHVVYSGDVQGVGFRYYVRRFASDLELAGWVKNLSNGCVELLAQGEKKLLEQLLAEVDSHFSGHIREKEISYQKPDKIFSDFQITYF